MKIKIHDTTYIFLLISFLAGYFEYSFILLIIVFIHEAGHYTFAILNKIKISQIVIYPFGGITFLECDLNISIKKELICLLGGIIFQIIFFLFVRKLYKYNLVTHHVYNLNLKINYFLISFNFLPIIPLDGGKLMNLFLDKIVPYKHSYIIAIIISTIYIIVFLLNKRTILSFILCIFLIKNIIIEIKNINIKYNKFILERYLNNYKFSKTKIVKNINQLKRDYYHIINNEFEEKYLAKRFDRHI